MNRIVNGNTSVIQTDGSIPIVYVSTTTLTDHFVTILDMVGAVPVHVSTTAGVTFTGGSSDAYIRNPFGYLSLAAVSTNQWSIANQDPFSLDISTIRALDTFQLSSISLVTTLISTNSLLSKYISLSSATVVSGSIGIPDVARSSMTTSLNLGANSLEARSAIASTSYMLNVSGLNASITGNAQIGGPIQIAQNFVGNTMTTSNFITSSVTTSSLTDTTLNSISLVTPAVNTSNATAANLFLGSTSIVFTPVAAASRIACPSTTTNSITSYSTFTSSIMTPVINGSMETIELGSTAIVNPFGLITLSSLTANTTQSQNIFGTNVSSIDMSVSSITMNTKNPRPTTLVAATGDLIQLSSCWSISANALMASTMRTSILSISSVNMYSLVANDLSANTLAPVTFSAESTMILEGQAFYVPLAPISAKQVVTSTIESGPFTVSSISGLQTILSDILYIPGLNAADISASSVITGQASTSTIHANNIILGKQVQVNPTDPSISVNSLNSLNQPPFQYATGAGTFNNPYKVFNTETTLIYISLYNPSGKTLYLNFSFRHTNLPPPNAGRNGGVAAYINGNMIYSVNNIYQQPLVESVQLDLNIANYPLQNLNPTTGDNTPYVVWSVASASVTTDEMTMWLSNNLNAVDNKSIPVIDPDGGITILKGIMQWPSTIYGTSIVNQFNDIETRSLFYTGSLQNVSDRALKKNIMGADLSMCVAATETPLHTYEYTSIFASTFQITDKRRLGLLTTEVGEVFPKSIGTATVLGTETQVLSTDQMRYAHLGATKYLIAEVARLKKRLSECA